MKSANSVRTAATSLCSLPAQRAQGRGRGSPQGRQCIAVVRALRRVLRGASEWGAGRSPNIVKLPERSGAPKTSAKRARQSARPFEIFDGWGHNGGRGKTGRFSQAIGGGYRGRAAENLKLAEIKGRLHARYNSSRARRSRTIMLLAKYGADKLAELADNVLKTLLS